MFKIKKKLEGQIWVQIYKEGPGEGDILRIEKQHLYELLFPPDKEGNPIKREDYEKLQDAIPGMYAVILKKRPERIEVCYTAKSFGLRNGEAIITENGRLFTLIKSLFN